MSRHGWLLPGLLVSVVALLLGAGTPPAWAQRAERFAIAKIFFELNASANDLGVHVFLDGEDWRTLKIDSPNGRTIFEVEGEGPYAELGLTELFFEGAEPSLDEVPLQELLGLFPEGSYSFVGKTVDGSDIQRTATLTPSIFGSITYAGFSPASSFTTRSWKSRSSSGL